MVAMRVWGELQTKLLKYLADNDFKDLSICSIKGCDSQRIREKKSDLVGDMASGNNLRKLQIWIGIRAT